MGFGFVAGDCGGEEFVFCDGEELHHLFVGIEGESFSRFADDEFVFGPELVSVEVLRFEFWEFFGEGLELGGVGFEHASTGDEVAFDDVRGRGEDVGDEVFVGDDALVHGTVDFGFFEQVVDDESFDDDGDGHDGCEEPGEGFDVDHSFLPLG